MNNQEKIKVATLKSDLALVTQLKFEHGGTECTIRFFTGEWSLFANVVEISPTITQTFWSMKSERLDSILQNLMHYSHKIFDVHEVKIYENNTLQYSLSSGGTIYVLNKRYDRLRDPHELNEFPINYNDD